MRKLLRGFTVLVWVATTLSWPLLKWLLGFDVVFQIARAAFERSYFSAARVGVHFAALVALTWYVTYYRPTKS